MTITGESVEQGVAAAQRTTARAVLPSAPTVFVVDDDPAMRRSLRWLVQSAGLAVQTYVRAEEFLEAYQDDKPGCLILDMHLPGMSGLRLQAELSSRKITLPVIFITAYGDLQTTASALQAGAWGFFEKPFSDEILLSRVRAALSMDRSKPPAGDGI